MVQFKHSLPVALSLVCVMVFTACGQQPVAGDSTPSEVATAVDSTNVNNSDLNTQNPATSDQAQVENPLDQQKVEEEPAFSESSDTLCTLEYMPVCGKRPIQCITTPCDPIEQTFSNRCVAESEGAIDIVDGACVMSADDF